MGIITLTTDFGLQDWFVGTMKGVMLRIQPRTQFVDITHQVPAGDVEAGALALAASFGFFPQGTVHLVVVDPGVGTERAALAVRTAKYTFVGPDNGVLSLALAKDGPHQIRRLENSEFFLPEVSQTFHGRDVFAPAAAHLSGGVPLGKLGPEAHDYVRLIWPEPTKARGRIEGRVVYIDRFGNALTNIPRGMLGGPTETGLTVRLPGRKTGFAVCRSYQAVPKGKPLGIFGSVGLLEVAINGGNAAKVLGLAKGSKVFLSP